MILRLKMILSVFSYERKTFFFMEKFETSKNNTFNNFFCNRIFLYYRLLQIFQKLLNFYKSWLIFLRKIFSMTLLFTIMIIKNKIFKYIYFNKKLL